ncbi:MAG: methylmalonyl-CoA mutase family protein, partial [Bacteroidota bacterium]
PILPGNEDWFGATGPEAYDQQLSGAFTQSALWEKTSVAATSTGEASWQVGAYVNSGTNAAINKYAQEEFAGGAEALLFRLYRQPGPLDLAQLLENIPADKISLHCSLRYPGQDPAELFRDLVHYLRKAGYQLGDIQGSVDFDPLLDWSDPPFPPLIRLLYFVSRWMPHFRVLQVNAAGFNNGVTTADVELALAVAKGIEYLRQTKERGYPPALANRHLKFAFSVGTSFYGDVAKLRVFRGLWTQALAEEFGLETPPPTQISAHTDVATLTQGPEQNRLQLALQGLAAVHGGADLLFLAPIERVDQPPSPVGRETARRLQLQLRGAGLGAIPLDETYLAALSDKLSIAAQRRLQHIKAQGGFAQATEF